MELRRLEAEMAAAEHHVGAAEAAEARGGWEKAPSA